ncbi:MAG TPA: carboxypeptidase-like regulatory domain-containing protein [Bryobacteraceae bacterium]|jgi:hypothetical protein|nr:carboxypeptidase-like regulatory domain-containing protein [Bryobacteraceae bacterium]
MLRLTIALFISMALFAQTDPNSQPPGQIIGHVQNAVTGDPVTGAQVRLIQFSPISVIRSSGQHIVSSQPDGSFIFDNVAPGMYGLVASAPSFSPGHYKANGSSNSMDSLTVQPGAQVAGLVVALQPYANLTGRVIDDTGQPVPHAQVRTFISVLLRGKTQLEPRTIANANNAGQFELKGVPSGKIYIVASPAPQVPAANPPLATSPAPETKLSLVSTFYPDSLDLANAVALDVHSGQDQGDIDVHMKRAATYHIRGKVKVAVSSDTKLVMEVSPRGGPVSYSPGQGTTVGLDGQFDIGDLIPGTYTLRLMESGSSGNVSRFSPAQHILSRQDVTIAAGDVNGLALAETPPVTLTWHARSEDDETANLSNVMISLLSWDDPPTNAAPAMSMSRDGSRTITVDAGHYIIHVGGVPPGSYISSLQINQTDALNKVVDLSQGGAGQVDIVFRKGLAELDGSLVSNDSSAPRAATIILVPESLAPDGSNLMMRGTGRNSAFSFTNVPPGRYTAFAVEQFNYNAWQNPSFIASLQGRGVSVDLDEKDRKRIELSVISSSDLLQAMAQMGLEE